MFQKVAPLQILSNQQVIKFLRDVLKIWENLLEELCIDFFFSKL